MSVDPGMKGVTVRTYRWRDQKESPARSYGFLHDPNPPEPEKAEDSASVVADLVKRIATLQVAQRKVKVIIDGDFIVLGTEIPDDQAPLVVTSSTVQNTTITNAKTPVTFTAAKRKKKGSKPLRRHVDKGGVR